MKKLPVNSTVNIRGKSAVLVCHQWHTNTTHIAPAWHTHLKGRGNAHFKMETKKLFWNKIQNEKFNKFIQWLIEGT